MVLKHIWTIHLTPELNWQQSVPAKPAWSLPDRGTRRSVTSLRKREGSERTPASVMTTRMSYILPLCLCISSIKWYQLYLPSFLSNLFQDWWVKRVITKLSVCLLSSQCSYQRNLLENCTFILKESLLPVFSSTSEYSYQGRAFSHCWIMKLGCSLPLPASRWFHFWSLWLDTIRVVTPSEKVTLNLGERFI